MLLPHHVAEGAVRIQRGHHRLGAQHPPLVRQLYTDGAAVLHQDLLDGGRLEDQPAVLDHLSTQRAGELVRASVAVAPVGGAIDHQGHHEAEPRLARVEPPHAAGVEHQGPHLLVLEGVGDDVQRAHLADLQHLLADLGLPHGHGDLDGRHGRDVGGRGHDVVDDPPPPANHLAEGHGVLERELADRVLGVVHHAAEQQRGAVLEHHALLGVGPDPGQRRAVQIEVPDRRHVVHHHVVEHVGIGGVAGIQVLLGGQSAAGLEATLADRHAEPGLGQVGAGDQPVGPGADDDDVELALLGELLLHVPERIAGIVLELRLVLEVRHGVLVSGAGQGRLAEILPSCGM